MKKDELEPTPLCNSIRYELAYLKSYPSVEPKVLVIGKNLADQFFKEYAHFVWKTEGVKFENPKMGRRQFLNLDVIVLQSHVSGFTFAFGE